MAKSVVGAAAFWPAVAPFKCSEMPPLFILNSDVPENSAANAAKIIVLIVMAASKALVFDTELVVKLVHVVLELFRGRAFSGSFARLLYLS